MGKALVALDGKPGSLRDIATICKELFIDWREHLYVGLVVKDLSYQAAISGYAEKAVFADHDPYETELVSEEEQKQAEAIHNFIKPAKKWGVRYEIYHDIRLTARELVKQTMFADLLILSYRLFDNTAPEKTDPSILYDILKESKCPTLIIPEKIRRIDNLVFTYDGKESSVFAIKAFANLFGRATREKITSILTVTPSLDEEILNEKLLLNLVKQHYNNVGVQLLEGTHITQEISNFARSVTNPLVIMGAFGRSSISNLFIPSVARGIIEEGNTPLFIAHP